MPQSEVTLAVHYINVKLREVLELITLSELRSARFTTLCPPASQQQSIPFHRQSVKV